MNANVKKVTRKLNIAKGQLEGISKMVEEDAYCLDISNQLLAAIALLKSVNHEILSAHLEHCIFNSNDDEIKEKLGEIDALLKRIV
jgi:DNA-binding FrmR family transcriptional regulator